ncbi:MAG: hypothetical protein ACR2JR_14660 [Rubrobacteraceae bacterium]
MKMLHDFRGTAIRLTDERLAHILEHPEMSGLEDAIDETLQDPNRVIRSRSDEQAQLYYRFYPDTLVGEKLLCVVVKVREEDAFILTTYLTDKLKEGEIIWSAES